MSFTSIFQKGGMAERFGVPTALAVVLLGIIHYDLISPLVKNHERNSKSQADTAASLAVLTELMRGMAYDTRHGTWRVTAPPPPSSLPPERPPHELSKINP